MAPLSRIRCHCRFRTGDQTARRIGLHADTLYRLCRTGQFPPAIQIGGRWRVSVPRLARYLHGDATSTHELGTFAGLDSESDPE